MSILCRCGNTSDVLGSLDTSLRLEELVRLYQNCQPKLYVVL